MLPGQDSFANFYRGKSVLVTGHTGFKGSWLIQWLSLLGAKVTGYSIDVPTQPSMFEICSLENIADNNSGCITDEEKLLSVIEDCSPDVVFHLAAQSIVRLSYSEPLKTLHTNVTGTAVLLETVRKCNRNMTVIVVTSDKCYENTGWVWGYRESDRLGGHDPYSMSKGVCELVVNSWRNSFFAPDGYNVRVASARAGNVIGGGDWAKDRIVTDCITSLTNHAKLSLRMPNATRPWQHVLEPIGGYLQLAKELAISNNPSGFECAWNFGPSAQNVKSVQELVKAVCEAWGEDGQYNEDSNQLLKEADILQLNCDQAHTLMNWFPTWDFRTTVEKTVAWYRCWHSGNGAVRDLTLEQIRSYERDAELAGITWRVEKAPPSTSQ